MTNKIILATSSPHRKKAFSTLGIDFIAEGSDVDEYRADRPTEPKELVRYLAKLKAEAVAKNHSSGIVVGFDSFTYFEDEIMEKAGSKEVVFERLKRLSGNTHDFFTGIHIINLDNGVVKSDVVETKAYFRELSLDEINFYLDHDKDVVNYGIPYDAPDHFSSSFLTKVDGCYNSLCTGLPRGRMMEMLKEVGYRIEGKPNAGNIKTMKDAQKLVKDFAVRNGWKDSPNIDKMDHLHEELIEMSQHLRYKDEAEREKIVREKHEIFKDGVGDLFFGLCRLANQLGVDIEDAFNMVKGPIINKFEKGKEYNRAWGRDVGGKIVPRENGS